MLLVSAAVTRQSRILLLACLGFLLATPACNAKLFGLGSAASASPTPPDSVLLSLCASIPLPVSDADEDDQGDDNDEEDGGNESVATTQSNNGNGNNSELSLFLRLSSDSEKIRSDAAKKLLRHAAKRSPATLESAIFVEGTLGDFRVLTDLDHIVVNRIVSDEEPAVAFDFGTPVRTGAAAAIGRIIEQDRSSPPGRPAGDHNDLDDERGAGHTDSEPAIDGSDIRTAVSSLELAACPGAPVELRGAALEALGLLRDPSAKVFLDAVAANAGEDDESQDLFLTTIAARSLTNITLNNHVLSLGLMPRIEALFEQAQGSQVTP